MQHIGSSLLLMLQIRPSLILLWRFGHIRPIDNFCDVGFYFFSVVNFPHFSIPITNYHICKVIAFYNKKTVFILFWSIFFFAYCQTTLLSIPTTSYHRKRHPMRHRHTFRQSLTYLIPELTVCVTAEKVRCRRESLQHFSIFITPRRLSCKQQRICSLSWRFACRMPKCVSHCYTPL